MVYEIISGDREWVLSASNPKDAAIKALNTMKFNQRAQLGKILSVRDVDEVSLNECWFLISELLRETNLKLRLIQ